jgi:voltage-gated potassium channel
MEKETDRTRRTRWQEVTRVPLLLGSAAFLLAYSWLILNRERHTWADLVFLIVLLVVWASFVVDAIVRLVLTARHERGSYLRHHRIDMLSAIIPILRPFGLLRYLPRLRGFRGNGSNSFRSRFVLTALAYEAMFVYVTSLAVLAVERGAPHATILSFGDAVWWACVTIATVGYGDYVPVTVLGRLLAVLLMVGGLVIIGTASATIVSYLNERLAQARERLEEERRRGDEDHGEAGNQHGGSAQHAPEQSGAQPATEGSGAQPARADPAGEGSGGTGPVVG